MDAITGHNFSGCGGEVFSLKPLIIANDDAFFGAPFFFEKGSETLGAAAHICERVMVGYPCSPAVSAKLDCAHTIAFLP
jgi:hypothetical protein